MTRKRVGWLFDLYPVREGMALWLIDRDTEERVMLRHPWAAAFYVSGPSGTAARAVSALGIPARVSPVERTEFYTNAPMQVAQVSLSPLLFPGAVRAFTDALINGRMGLGGCEVFTCDIPPAQLYLYETGLFPLALCTVEHDEAGRVLAVSALDSPKDIRYALPPLRTMSLTLEGDPVNPSHSRYGRRTERIEVGVDGIAYALEPEGMAGALRRLILLHDPDVIRTRWGDGVLVPALEEVSLSSRTAIPFSRDPEGRGPSLSRKARSYFIYGQIVFKAAIHIFRGRWHLDEENSFFLGEAGDEGLFELARLVRVPVQQLARASIGTAISSAQLEVAHRLGYLIPWRKHRPEGFKSALDLISTDKGGLTYLPPVGFFENVAELDFSSMYPTIMARFNISPETVGCACCPENRVPEIGYTLCTRRRGLVPMALEPLLAKRAAYKSLAKETPDPAEKAVFSRRQSAMKWIMVACFGYLGYRNARFGRIEAHESVTAMSRELLLQAKEMAEARGFRMLHAIVDSLWLHRPGATKEEYEALTEEISRAVNMPIGLEGIYKWINFVPSKMDPRVGVHNRFYGAFTHGEVKVRGLELRRHDTPRLVVEAQRQMIDILAQAGDGKGFLERVPEVREVLESCLRRIREGKVRPLDLAIRRRLSRAPSEYRTANLMALVSHQLLAQGVRLEPGEMVEYIISDDRSPVKEERARAVSLLDGDFSYDIEKYCELLLEAYRSLHIDRACTPR